MLLTRSLDSIPLRNMFFRPCEPVYFYVVSDRNTSLLVLELPENLRVLCLRVRELKSCAPVLPPLGRASWRWRFVCPEKPCRLRKRMSVVLQVMSEPGRPLAKGLFRQKFMPDTHLE